ncbi:MFS transporter [Chryseobacterium sp. Mn2064]|uniref:MFS transporter n=1 Tax=Chryseobacterium sp. Mn2064 TaxID=3395263 RepID=UPI003BE58742
MNKNDTTWKHLFSNGNGLKTITLALGVMLHATNVYLATTIMPSIIKEIGGLEYYAWNTTIFIVASVIGSVVSANQMGKSGPRKAYQIGILLFSIGVLVCSSAPTMYVLLAGRFIQGFGGGLLFALSYAMIRLIFSEELWSRAMALVSGMWGIAAFSGPFIGGIFAENGHWRMAFGVLLIFCIFLLIISSRTLPKIKNQERVSPIPYLKLALLGLAALTVSISSIQKDITGSLIGICTAFFLLVLLVISEKKSKNRLLPTGAYTISTPLGTTYSIMALLTIATSIEIYVPYFAQIIDGLSPLQSGYLTVLIAIGWTLSSLLFSGLKENRVNKVIPIGAFIMLLGLIGLCYFSVMASQTFTIKLILTCIFLLLIGIGIGMGWPHLLTKVFSLSPSGEEDLASSSVTTVQLIATSFGAAIAGLVTNFGGITHPGGIIGTAQASVYLYGSFAVAPLIAIILCFLLKMNQSK